MAIAILTPDIIKEGRYYIARTPLYAINEANNFIPLWTNEELNEAREQNKKISRFKGLGELNPKQLKACLINPETRQLIPITFSEDIEKLTNLFSNVTDKRKLLANGGLI